MQPLLNFTTIVSDVKFDHVDENCFRVDIIVAGDNTTDALISPYKIPHPDSPPETPVMVDNAAIGQHQQGLAQFVIRRLLSTGRELKPGNTYHIRFFFNEEPQGADHG